jgi:PhnB protein
MSAPATNPNPSGMHTVTPHLVCAGAADAIRFYINAFGAVEECRLPGPDGKIMHAMIRIGDSAVMLADEFPECGGLSPKSLNGSPVTLHLYVEDVDAAMQRAADAGGEVTMPPQDMFWGDRYGQMRDPYGHRWSLATHIRDVTPDEMQEAMKQQFGSGKN